jgi:hypothetical protein
MENNAAHISGKKLHKPPVLGHSHSFQLTLPSVAAYEYWSKLWKERPDNRREVRRPKDLKRIPRYMYLPDVEDKDIQALQGRLKRIPRWKTNAVPSAEGQDEKATETLPPLDLLPPGVAKQIIKLAERGLAPRDPEKLAYRIGYLFHVQEHMPGFDAAKLAAR